MKKTLLLCFVFLLFNLSALAQTASAPSGSGSQTNPYQITSLENLYWISVQVGGGSTFTGKYFSQTQNIDASATYNWFIGSTGRGWIPIGTSSNKFSGNYIGNNHTIDGLTCGQDLDDIGLFGYIEGAIIQNVGVTNVIIIGNDHVGSLVGYQKNSTINNCYSSGEVIGSGSYEMGGLVGRAENSVVDFCHSSATVKKGDGYATPIYESGGLVSVADHTTISNSYFTGYVEGSSSIGGLVGEARYATVSNCYCSGNVTGVKWVGGLVGENTYYSSIYNSYSSGSVSGTSYVGGLVGYNFYGSSIYNSYSKGGVSGSTSVGGLVGQSSFSNTYRSFWDRETSGQNSSAGGTGKTTQEMKSSSTYLSAGWDFKDETANGSADIWTIDEKYQNDNEGYPALAWQGLEHGILYKPSGDGTESTPYLISSLGNLEWMSIMAERGHTFVDSFFQQTQDIDALSSKYMNDEQGLLPIGNSNTTFSGTYNGNGFTIDGLFILRPSTDYLGLFGYLEGASIKNLVLSNATVTGNNYVGILTGRIVHSTLSNCSSSGSLNGVKMVGGLAGVLNNSTISTCYNSASIRGTGNHVGGVVGYSYNSAVNNSYNIGSVRGLPGSSVNIGGVVGYSYTTTVTKCYSVGSVFGSSLYKGGLVGDNHDVNSVTDSFWDMETSGVNTSAGGTGKTTAEMKLIATYIKAGWDFENEVTNGAEDIWTIHELYEVDNAGYPALAWQGLENSTFSQPQGEGLQSNPYLITSLENLYWMNQQLQMGNNFSGTYFSQTQDIDASETSGWFSGAGWLPIGNDDNQFSGN